MPVECEEHISSVYVKLGSPRVNFYSFWDVYNQLCDAVESDLLACTTIGTSTRCGESVSEDEDEQLLLSDLHPCVFGENGVPAGQLSGEASEGSGSGTATLVPSPFYADSCPPRSRFSSHIHR